MVERLLPKQEVAGSSPVARLNFIGVEKMDTCPKCGSLLEVIECCGGGIFLCERCKEYYYPGELINPHIHYEEDSKEDPLLPLEDLPC